MKTINKSVYFVTERQVHRFSSYDHILNESQSVNTFPPKDPFHSIRKPRHRRPYSHRIPARKKPSENEKTFGPIRLLHYF